MSTALPALLLRRGCCPGARRPAPRSGRRRCCRQRLRGAWTPLPRTAVGDLRLEAALETYATTWDAATSDLVQAAEAYADVLKAAAAEYVEVDALLVPRALR